MKKSSIYLCVITLVFALFCMQKSFAQVNAYSFSQSIGSYVPLSGTPNVAYAAPWDDTTLPVQVAIPFSFTFDGSTYLQCTISPNGFITFGGVLPTSNNYTPLSNTSFYSGAISALGMDLASNGSPIVYDVVGIAPNRTFVIQWVNAIRKSATGNYNFQIRLNETTNSIEFTYGSCIPPAGSSTVNTQVGLRGPSNVASQGNINNRQQGTSTPWFNQTFNNTSSIGSLITSDTAYPEEGLNFKYIPALPCVTPSAAPTNLIIGGTAINDTSFTGNSFVPASPAPTNYLILRSTVNIPPTSSNIVNRTYYITTGTYGNYYVVANTTTSTFASAGLTPTTTYYYWIIPYNNNCTGAPFYYLNNILTASATTCYTRVSATAATTIGGNSFTANWNAVTGAAGYAIDVSTSNTFATMLPGYNNLQLGSGVTSVIISNLSPVTTYYYRVRAFSSSPSCLLNSSTISVTTLCGYYTIPYAQNFDSFATGTLPICYSRSDVNGDGFQWETQSLNFASASRSMMIGKNPTLAMNDWLFMPGLSLTAGISYRLFFRYNTGNTSNTVEKLKVRLGTSANVASMTQNLLDYQNITNSNYEIAVVDFVSATTGIYYIGFQGYSLSNQSYIVIDDISVTITPSCFEPTNIITSLITSNSVTLTWTPSSPAPANGYEYYISTSSTAPINTTIPTGSVGAGVNSLIVNSLLPSTFYYVWVRGNCSTNNKSTWSIAETFNTQCTSPSVVSTTSATRCGYGTATISAVPSSGSMINWYATNTDNSVLATGNTFTTQSISSSTTFYAQAKSNGVIENLGPASPLSLSVPMDIQNYQASIFFNVTSNTTLLSFDIFPIVSAQPGLLVLRNSSGIQIATFPFTTTVSGGNIAQVIPINTILYPGNYSIYFSIVPASGIKINSDNVIYPFTSNVANITGNTENNSAFLGLYNWKFTSECLSARVPVSVTVTAPPLLQLSSSSSSICSGSSTSLLSVTGYFNYDDLMWTPPTGISGTLETGFIFNPTTTTTYTLTGMQIGPTSCGNQLTYTVVVKPIPPPVSVVPNAIVVCQNTVQSLNGGTGVGVAVPIYSENFNTATNDWIVANTSIGGDIYASQWTLRPNNYNYANSYGWDVTFSSNDSSQFYLANSDSQSGIVGTTTSTTLTSPTINLVGYTTATLSFWHYLRYVTDDIVQVQISSDGGINWTTVRAYNSAQGTASNFSNDTVDLTSYIGTVNFKIRFNFSSDWGYAWAIDNVLISGILATALTWSPVANLFTDANATTPYVAGTQMGVVYTKPTSNITYTATMTGANGCVQTGTAIVTLGPITLPGTISSNQIICNGAVASNILLTGNIGDVIRWEYADDLNFTINVTPIVNTSSVLTMAQMGSFTATRYFRAVIKNGNCNQVFTNVVYVTFSTTTWDGSTWSNGIPDTNKSAIFNGNYTSAGDLTACSVVVNSGVVTFNSNHNLIVTNEVSVVGGSLIFENNSSLIQINNSVNSGNIIYKRSTTPMKKFDYTYWSSPVNPQSLFNLSPLTLSDKFFSFSPIIGYWSNENSNTIMNIGKGYIIRAPQNFNPSIPAIYNAVFSGVPNNGPYSIPIQVSTSPYNLIGNPYPSAVSANLLLSNSLNTSVIDGTIYLWTHNTPITNFQYTSNDYAVYNYLGGTGTTSAPNLGINNSVPNGKIAAGQSFFVKGLTNGNAIFLNSMRLVGNNNLFFKGNMMPTIDNSNENRIWLEVKDSFGGYKQTLIGYSPFASYGLDRGYDSELMNETPTYLYSISGTTKLAIQGRPMPFQISDEIPLGFHADVAGTFSIGLNNFDGIFGEQNIYLKDNQTNIKYDLKQGDYIFTSNDGTYEDRFSIIFQNDTNLHTNSSIINPNSIVLFKPNQDLNIDAGSFIMDRVKIFDARGSLIIDKEAISSSRTSINIQNISSILLLEITLKDGEIVLKKYLNK